MSYSKGMGLFSAILIVVTAFTVNARSERTAVNSVFAEALGPGLLYSLNYERLVLNDLGVRAGFSWMSFKASANSQDMTNEVNASITTIPLIASYLGISSGSHTLEIGGGPTLLFVSGTVNDGAGGINVAASGMSAYGNILLGYRIHPVNGGFQFRVGFSGMFGNGFGAKSAEDGKATFGFQPWLYLSLGGCF